MENVGKSTKPLFLIILIFLGVLVLAVVLGGYLIFSTRGRFAVSSRIPGVQVEVTNESKILDYLNQWNAFEKNTSVYDSVTKTNVEASASRIVLVFVDSEQEDGKIYQETEKGVVLANSTNAFLKDSIIYVNTYLNLEFYRALEEDERDTILSDLTMQSLYNIFSVQINRDERLENLKKIHEEVTSQGSLLVFKKL